MPALRYSWLTPIAITRTESILREARQNLRIPKGNNLPLAALIAWFKSGFVVPSDRVARLTNHYEYEDGELICEERAATRLSEVAQTGADICVAYCMSCAHRLSMLGHRARPCLS